MLRSTCPPAKGALFKNKTTRKPLLLTPPNGPHPRCCRGRVGGGAPAHFGTGRHCLPFSFLHLKDIKYLGFLQNASFQVPTGKTSSVPSHLGTNKGKITLANYSLSCAVLVTQDAPCKRWQGNCRICCPWMLHSVQELWEEKQTKKRFAWLLTYR